MWYWHKNRHIDQWNRIENRISSCTHGQSTTKEARVYNGKKTVSSISSTGKTGQLTCKRTKLEHSLTLYTKINSKWIKDLNVRLETIKLPEENIVEQSYINCSSIFFGGGGNLPLQAKEIKAKINKWDLEFLLWLSVLRT